MTAFYLGCAIWGYRPWIGTWLPARTQDMVRAYSERLTMVEINATFYGLPDTATVTRWADSTPITFRFCPKLPRAISHSNALALQLPATLEFCDRMRGLGARLGTCFLQLGPSYGPDRLADLEAWLAGWPTDLPLAVEVRHPRWYSREHAEQLNTMLQEYRAARVIIDSRAIYTGPTTDPDVAAARRKKPDVPLQLARTMDWTLIRFMGHPDVAIDRPLLQEWASRIQGWLSDGTTVYMAMHCPDEQRSPEFCAMIAAELIALGLPNPLPTVEEPPQQLSMF